MGGGTGINHMKIAGPCRGGTAEAGMRGLEHPVV